MRKSRRRMGLYFKDTKNGRVSFLTNGVACREAQQESGAAANATGNWWSPPESGAEEDVFALEHLDGDEQCRTGVHTGGGKDHGDGVPMVRAGDNFLADQTGA